MKVEPSMIILIFKRSTLLRFNVKDFESRNSAMEFPLQNDNVIKQRRRDGTPTTSRAHFYEVEIYSDGHKHIVGETKAKRKIAHNSKSATKK